MTKPRLRLVTPATVNRTVTLRRPRNGEVRTREHLTEDEAEKLIEAAKNNRHGHRDALMLKDAERIEFFVAISAYYADFRRNLS